LERIYRNRPKTREGGVNQKTLAAREPCGEERC
jgi:hypothetical protein